MNNMDNLYPCLNSIKKFTFGIKYETLVVAYLFSKENLDKAKRDHQWVTFIESNEIRGFSENNNLALRLSKGKYCFVLNDDTYFDENTIGTLVKSFPSDDRCAIVSPITLNKNGSVQRCGKPKYNIGTYILGLVGLLKKYETNSQYTNKIGIFKTYNISGAAFLIRRDIFEKFGWFDEKYFFCPEDIALSTLLNKNGYECYVNSNTKLTHACGGTWSKTILATKPATVKGLLYFYRDESFFAALIYSFLATFEYFFKMLYWLIKNSIKTDEHRKVMLKANWHGFMALFSFETPKQLFTRYYLQMKNEK